MQQMRRETSACLSLVVGLLSYLIVCDCPLRADDWPQWRGPTRDGVWKETGIVKAFPAAKLALRWQTPIGSGYCGPTVAQQRVYLTDRQTEPGEVERVHCFDWQTGRSLWTYAYDCPYKGIQYTAGPRASVSVDDHRAYALGAMGHLLCLDADTGELLWKKQPGADYQVRVPTWGIAAAPLVDGDLLIVQIGGADGACVVALDKKTGAERWRALDDGASYSAPVIVQQAGRRVLVCWTAQHVAGLDPASGKVYWQHPFRQKMVINVPTPVVQGDRLFVSSFYDGSLMLKLRQDELAVEEIWRRRGKSERNTDALHAMIVTPYFEGDYVYGVDSYGELRCLEAATGNRIWEDLTAVPKARWATLHMVRNDGQIWMFNERGELMICTLSPQGFHEISRAKLIEPTTEQLPQRGGVCWSHPAFAYQHVFARNDRELVCASLAAGGHE
jgi:outer membrane protein assembly factor BamB